MRLAGGLAVFLGLAASAFGDGFPIKDGRYQGRTTVLRLTPSQTKALGLSRDLKLTKSQQAALKGATGVAPSELYVYFTKDGENDHTCMAYNVAMRFAETAIEVPHEYLVDDAEAAKRKKELDEAEGVP